MVEVVCYRVVDVALDRQPHRQKTSFASQSTEEGVMAVQDKEEVVSAVAGPGMVEAGCCRVVDGALDRQPHRPKTSCASQSTEEGVRAVQDKEEGVSAVAGPGMVGAGCCRVVDGALDQKTRHPRIVQQQELCPLEQVAQFGDDRERTTRRPMISETVHRYEWTMELQKTVQRITLQSGI
jgi:hypothetical protein